jgi:hypothetical protein
MRRLKLGESLRRLLGRDEDESDGELNISHNVNAKIRIHLHKAINGKVIEVHSYNPKPNSHESDWDSEFYIIPEGESLHAAVATVLTMKGLAAC